MALLPAGYDNDACQPSTPPAPVPWPPLIAGALHAWRA